MGKGTAMVVMDRQDYNCKALELLDDKDTYKSILKDPTPKYKSQLINLLKSCKTQGQITQDTCKKTLLHLYINPQILWLTLNPQNRYPLRPIVSSRDSIMYGVAKEIANILQPLVDACPNHIRNTQHFIEEAKFTQIQ